MTWAKRLIFLFIAVSGAAGADPMQEVLAVDDARTAALIAADRPALDRTLARELRYVHSNGLTQDRAAYLAAAVGGAMQYRVIEPLQRQARPLSGTAMLLTGSNHVEVVLERQAPAGAGAVHGCLRAGRRRLENDGLAVHPRPGQENPAVTALCLGASAAGTPVELLAAMANRHGLIAGATGTGKTVTLQALAEGFSRAGVPVFLADVKGDLSGLAQASAATLRLVLA